MKLGQVAQPLRAALTGRATSPRLFDVMAVLGRDESLARLRDQVERRAGCIATRCAPLDALASRHTDTATEATAFDRPANSRLGSRLLRMPRLH